MAECRPCTDGRCRDCWGGECSCNPLTRWLQGTYPNRIRSGYPDRTPTNERTNGLTEKSDPDVNRPTAVDASARKTIRGVQ